jgi:hypothetical protein
MKNWKKIIGKVLKFTLVKTLVKGSSKNSRNSPYHVNWKTGLRVEHASKHSRKHE